MLKICGFNGTKDFIVSLSSALFCAVLSCGIALWAAQLQVHMPGGLQAPMKQCAEAFTDAKVILTAGKGSSWMEAAAKDADVILIGAAHLYSYFIIQYPDAVNNEDWIGLYPRPAGILVRKGNPKNIKNLEALANPGMRLLNVACSGQVAAWEDITGRAGLTEAVRKNFAVTVPSGFIGAQIWEEDKSLDAWLTFASWHYTQKDWTDLVEIPDTYNVFRFTMAAVTARCR